MLATALVFALGAFEPDALLPGKPWVLRGHTDAVTCVALSPDGAVVASGSRDRTVKLWNRETGAALHTVPGAEVQVSALAFSADGKRLASGDVGLQVRVIDVASGAVSKTLAHPDAIGGLAFSPDGAALAVAGVAGNGAVYELEKGARRFEFRGRGVAWTADGKTLIVANASGSVAWLDAKTGKVRKIVETPREAPLTATNPAGTLVAAWSVASAEVKLWNEKGEAKGVLAVPPVDDRPRARPQGVAVTADAARVLVAYADGPLRVWRAADAQVVHSFPVERVIGLATSNGVLAVATGPTVLLWKLP